MKYQAGALVRVRERDWVVLPSNNEDLLLLKPLAGSDEEITGIYLPLEFAEDKIASTEFPKPAAGDIGDISSARLLYNAVRLSFRNAAGPFRCLAKLSVRPRSYQMVPLIMALRQQPPVRLLIADDVGVGKTVEALLVLKEMLERREIERFAVIVLPHLCDQWQQELRDKFGIEAVIIRSNTQARLDREIPDDTGVFKYYPYQVISIDYIKSESHRELFIQECPEMVIVDEAHTASKPVASDRVQQQRYRLIRDISRKKDQHLILLTATPHSGKKEQFNSLLSLLDEKYRDIDLPASGQKERRELAGFYVQRRRKDVERWLGEETLFPERDSGEFPYELSDSYLDFYDKIRNFAFDKIRQPAGEVNPERRKLRYWAALALLRGVMSSPAAGIKMLQNRLERQEDKIAEQASAEGEEQNPVIEDNYLSHDFLDTQVMNRGQWSESEMKILRQLEKELENLKGIRRDFKAKEALKVVKSWLVAGDEVFNCVIFCRFIETANYIGEILKNELYALDKHINVQVVTSEYPDEVRKQVVEDMKKSTKKVLVATDCLSEGVNLQDQFTAVLHYDLPWNPNRLEQREGRVDRFGQQAEIVKGFLLYGVNNPIDGVVLKVLLKKVREIRDAIGISIPFPEDSKSLMDAVLQEVMEHPGKSDPRQLSFDFAGFEQVKEKELIATRVIEEAARREKVSRDIFAQNAIHAHEIEPDLEEADRAVGRPAAVEKFVCDALDSLLGVQVTAAEKGYLLYPANLPAVLKPLLPEEEVIKITFVSPTPAGYNYIGRNHPFVEQLCRYLLGQAADRGRYGPARAAVIRSREVDIKTTLLLFRVRNVIESKKDGTQLVAEEMLLHGYEGSPTVGKSLSHERVEELMNNTLPSSSLSEPAMRDFLEAELKEIAALKEGLDNVARERAEILIAAHERFSKVVGGKRFKVVEPVLPMDLMGIYIILPEKKGGQAV